MTTSTEIFEAQAARERASAFLAEATGLTVETAEDMTAAAELRDAIKRAERAAEEDREALKRPLLEEGRRIDGAFRPAKQAFAGAVGIIDRGIRAYREREETKRRAEELRRRQESERERQRLARLAEKAEAKGLTETADRLEREAEMVPVPTVESRAVKPDGMVVRKSWRFEVVDVAAIPRKYLVVDEAAIRKVVNALGAEHGIPGVRVWTEETYATRTVR